MTLQVEKPNRRKHSYVQKIHGSPDTVFSLLCPVLEVEWVKDWMPKKVISASGVAEQECVFITPNEPHDAIWIVSKHDPENLNVEMYKVTPEHTVVKLEASVSADGEDAAEVVISYEFTAINRSGEEFLQECTVDWYEKVMVDWEDSMNRYLAK
jgi:hypothetical protein